MRIVSSIRVQAAGGLVALAIGGVVLPAQAAPAPRLELRGPASVAVGAPLVLTLVAQNATDLGAYEAHLRFDRSVAEFAGLQQRDAGLTATGRDFGALLNDAGSDGLRFGAYTCPLADCSDQSSAAKTAGASGEVTLATVTLKPQQAGALQLALDDVLLVGTDGTAQDASGATLTVQVGEGGSAHAAPPAADVAASTAAVQSSLHTSATLPEVAAAWRQLHERRTACSAAAAAYDLNNDGCLDAADVQRAAAQPAPDTASLAATTAALTFTVNTTGDGDDANRDGVCATSSNNCSLRAAIQEANYHAGPDTIAFNISGGGVKTIQLGSQLPSLSDNSGATTIDGYSQPGASTNTASTGSNADIRIEVRGNGAGNGDGILLLSAGNIIRGIAWYNHNRGIDIAGKNAKSNIVVGNFIGTDAAGTFMSPARYDEAFGGVAIHEGATGNQIGSANLADRNVITGGAADGISIKDEGTQSNVVQNNIIGLGPDGSVIGNWIHGVDMDLQTAYNLVGGWAPGQGNLVSGNKRSGLEVSHQQCYGNAFVGNTVGTDLSGKQVKGTGNGSIGIHVEDGVLANVVYSNIVGGNQGGIGVEGVDTVDNGVAGNYVGVTPDGKAIGNSLYGIQVFNSAARTTISGNTIANNPVGVAVTEDSGGRTKITRNAIFNNGGRGIDLAPIGTTNPSGSSGGKWTDSPVIERAITVSISGQTCANCVVEVFVATEGSGTGEGRTFVGDAQADGNGRFDLYVQPGRLGSGTYVTATATDPNGNTSEFGKNKQVTSSPAGTLLYRSFLSLLAR